MSKGMRGLRYVGACLLVVTVCGVAAVMAQVTAYPPAGGIAELISNGVTITSTLPILAPNGDQTTNGYGFASVPDAGLYIASSELYVSAGVAAGRGIVFRNNNSEAWRIDTPASGQPFRPSANDVRDIGQTSRLLKELFLGRAIQGSKSKTITDNTATAFVRLSVADDDYEGCGVIYTAYAEDTATDARQTRTGRVHASILNNSGTETVAFSTGDSSVVVTAGTFTCTFDGNSASADTIDLRATCDTSLAATTTLTFEYRLDCPSTVTVTPQ